MLTKREGSEDNHFWRPVTPFPPKNRLNILRGWMKATHSTMQQESRYWKYASIIHKKNVESSRQSQWSILFTKHLVSLPCVQGIYSLRGKGRNVHTWRLRHYSLENTLFWSVIISRFSFCLGAVSKERIQDLNCILLIFVFLLPFGESGMQWVLSKCSLNSVSDLYPSHKLLSIQELGF